jgi:hypothetical protein
MQFFKKHTNKTFDYKPRFYKHDGEGSPFEIKHKFEDFRKHSDKLPGLRTRFTSAFDELKNTDRKINKTILIIVVILVLMSLYIIDFDLSIFTNK